MPFVTSDQTNPFGRAKQKPRIEAAQGKPLHPGASRKPFLLSQIAQVVVSCPKCKHPVGLSEQHPKAKCGKCGEMVIVSPPKFKTKR